jgi:hypothetical protein
MLRRRICSHTITIGDDTRIYAGGKWPMNS